MPRRLVHDRVEVGVRKSVLLDALEEPQARGRIGDVGGRRLASTTIEDAAYTAVTVNNNGARITGGGEGTRLIVVGEDSPFGRGLVSTIAEIFADVGEYTVSAAYGDASGIAALDNEQARFTVAVKHVWFVYEVFRDEVLKWEEAVMRILEHWGGVHLECEVVLRVHLEREVVLGDLCAWI